MAAATTRSNARWETAVTGLKHWNSKIATAPNRGTTRYTKTHFQTAFMKWGECSSPVVWNIQLALSSKGTLNVARNPAISTNVRISGAASAPLSHSRKGMTDDEPLSMTKSEDD